MSEITHQDYVELLRRVEKLESKVKTLEYYVDQQKYFGDYKKDCAWGVTQSVSDSAARWSRCLFENLSPEDRNKPMSISCTCNKCSPYSMGG